MDPNAAEQRARVIVAKTHFVGLFKRLGIPVQKLSWHAEV